MEEVNRREKGLRKRAGTGAVFLGIGLGGFIDGILLHQILQWHQMLSTVLPPTDLEAMEVNMMWDGFFHAFVLLMTIAGVFLLWSVARKPVALPRTRWFVGLLVFGWGLFNFFEGIIDHHILGIHHVRYAGDVAGGDPLLAWNLGFVLIGGLGLMALGWFLWRDEAQKTEAH